ncbi:MAG: transferase, partial [Euryarchaeota archaeon]|nr:transferase [Euryarchaeota archaeon]
NRFVKKNDALVISSYLPLIEEIKLEIALGQWPQIWRPFEFRTHTIPDQQLRKKLTEKIAKKNEENIDNILSFLIFELLPVCYLEDFTAQNDLIEKLPWPKSPKFIFTSNNFHTDEIFKLWTALKVDKGTKYYIGQHGNNYYTKKNISPTIEEKTADKFITWGWTNGLSNYKSGFIFNTAGKKKNNYNNKGGLLLIEGTYDLKGVTWDTYSEFDEYFKDQKKFVTHLTEIPKKNLKIKLYPGFQNKHFKEDSRWLDFDPSLRIIKENSNIRNLIKNSRLVVHSYDSSGILELLSLNVPFIAFLYNKTEHLRDSAKPYYNLLEKEGIIHYNVDSAIFKINEIYENIDKWWKSDNVQEARNIFCKKFARTSKNPGYDISKIINTIP